MRTPATAPAWLVLAALPVVMALAWATGLQEHRFVLAQIANQSAALRASVDESAPVGGVALGIGLIATDLLLLGAAFQALLSALGRRQHEDAPFPWLAVGATVAALTLCLACSVALGVAAAWSVVMGLVLWWMVGSPVV